MNQARRSNRRLSSPKQRLIGHGLREIVLIFFCFVGLYLFVSLLTYYPVDPGWSHSGQVEEIKNKGGVAGALFADVFFYFFGYFAYLFPVMVGYVGWLVYRGKHHDILAEPKELIVPGIGFVLTLSAGCGLAIVHFAAESVLLPSHAGGILGMWVGKTLVSVFDRLGATLILLAVFFTGVTLLTGLSWLKLMDTLGLHTLRYLPLVEKYASRNLFPWLRKQAKQSSHVGAHLLKKLVQQVQKGAQVAYTRWQIRRNEWQQENEYYEYEDDDYFVKEEADPPVRQQAEPISPVQQQTEQAPEAQPSEPVVKTPPTTTVPLLPDLSLLNPLAPQSVPPDTTVLGENLVAAFQSLQVEVNVDAVHPGPVLTSFEVQTITPINTHHLDELNEALAGVLAVATVHSVEIQPGVLNVEIPNTERQTVYLNDLLTTPAYQDSASALTIALGQDVGGQPVVVDLSYVPHVLIAGSHATEKTLAINTIILSLLYKSTPQDLRLVLVDSLTQELSLYTDLPHLLIPVVQETTYIPHLLKWCLHEVEQRYRTMARLKVRNIEHYNHVLRTEPLTEEIKLNYQPLPYIVVIIHEMAEIVKSSLGGETEELIVRLIQKSRAAGIHLVLATQYPSVNVISGLIKSSIPTRIAFQVTNKSESRAILGQMGAEKLLGEGDMLYMTAGTGMPARVHGSFITVQEVHRVATDLKTRAKPDYITLKIEE